jgi:diguanylate cyclase (GGDEF)-like protein
MKSSLSRKLGLGSATVLLLVVALGFFTVVSHQSFLDQLRTFIQLNLPLDRAITRIALHHGEAAGQLRALLRETDPSAMSLRLVEFDRHAELAKRAVLETISLTEGSRLKKAPPGFRRLDRSVIRLSREYQELQTLAADYAQVHSTGAGNRDQIAERLAQIEEYIAELSGLAREFTAFSLTQSEGRARLALITAGGISGLGVVLTLVLFSVAGGAGTRIRRLAQEAGNVAVAIRNDELTEDTIADGSGDEIGVLGRTLDSLVDAVRANVAVRERLLQDLEQTSQVDKLTGATNRQRFTALLEDEVLRAGRYGSNVSLVHFDVDGLAKINEEQDFATGDYVLTTISQIVRHNLRKTDRFVRWTGGSFFVLATETPIEGAAYVAERIRRNVEVHPYDTVGGVTISCGVVQMTKGDTAEQLIQKAESALEQAQSAGGNRVLSL